MDVPDDGWAGGGGMMIELIFLKVLSDTEISRSGSSQCSPDRAI